jgi:MraZ protein
MLSRSYFANHPALLGGRPVERSGERPVRALRSGALRCFSRPSRNSCIEGGGKSLFDRYTGVIEELEFGDPIRSALEVSVLGGMAQLSYDTAGRITLPEILCEQFGLTDWVVVVGLGDRFQIWNRDAFQAHRAAQREVAREGLATMRAQQRAAKLSSAG